MNKKQKIVLWLGIAVFVLMGLYPPADFDGAALDPPQLLIQWAMVVVVAGGLLVTLKDKPKP